MAIFTENEAKASTIVRMEATKSDGTHKHFITSEVIIDKGVGETLG